MISSDDLIKYKNETGNSEHESIDFTQISSITNHIDDKLIVNGKNKKIQTQVIIYCMIIW